MSDPVVYIVHNVDTEGPLYESLEATFERLQELFGIQLEASEENLQALAAGRLAPADLKDDLSRVLDSKKIRTFGTWDQISEMLNRAMAPETRNTLIDSFGGGWVYTWHVLSHVSITGENPRRRDVGWFNVFDFYNEKLAKKDSRRDDIQWHFHSPAISGNAHRAGCTFMGDPTFFQILARYVVERSWFPSVFRAGHCAERNDLNFMLEQWFPFDFSNNSIDPKKSGFSKVNGRFSDWRRAPVTWQPYSPSFHDYQVVGECKRKVGRCLSIDERAYRISLADVEQAFIEAAEFGSAILAVTNHDFREMVGDVKYVCRLLESVSQKYPDISFRYTDAADAMRRHYGIKKEKPGLDVCLRKCDGTPQLFVSIDGALFGNQPFLAIKTCSGDYFWQNLDEDINGGWSYSFDEHNIPLHAIDTIGVAANSPSGISEVRHISPGDIEVLGR